MKEIENIFKDYNFNFDDEKIKAEVREILHDNFDKNNNVDVWRKCLSYIDLTSLNATDTEGKIKEMMQRVNGFSSVFGEMENVAAVCLYPSLVPIAKETLSKETKIAAVSACFPSSQTFVEVKIAEVAMTAMAGADEIDVVISVGKFLSGNYMEVFDELQEIKAACRGSHLKVIIESGALPSLIDVKKASIIAIEAGADFIKTSTGKTEPAATLQAALVMCQTIEEHYKKTGKKVGFKPAGGVVTTDEAVQYYTIVEKTLPKEWISKDLFRIGASRLANNLLSSIYSKEIKYY